MSDTTFWVAPVYRNGRYVVGTGGYHDQATAEIQARRASDDPDFCRVEVIARPDVPAGTITRIDSKGRHAEETGRIVATYKAGERAA